MPIDTNKLAKLKKRLGKNPNVAQAAAARIAKNAPGKERHPIGPLGQGAPGQLKKQMDIKGSARQFTPAGPKRNFPAVPKTNSNPLNPAMASRLPIKAGKPANFNGNRSAAAATKYGFDVERLRKAAKTKLGK